MRVAQRLNESFRRSALLWLVLLVAAWFFAPRAAGAAKLDTHDVVLDVTTNKLIPWTAIPAEGYDRVMFLSWDMLLNRMPNDPANGLKVVYTHSEYLTNSLLGSTWPNNPAGKNAMLADAAVLYYAYSGNTSVVQLVRGLLDYQIQRGSTPTNYNWPKIPWSTGAGGSTNYGNDNIREGVGVIEPDKLGELGYHGYLRFYQLTGETNYLNAALACADALASTNHVQPGNATSSPWPFRVNAQTGATVEQYCTDVIAPIRLFDELVRLGLGNTNAYQTARQTAWNWLMTYPMSNNVWANYFEDVQPQPGVLNNVNSYNPGQTARYLMERPELDPGWLVHASNLLHYVTNTFGGTDQGEIGQQYGARVISEQVLYKYKMASHTGRYAANRALFYSLTGNLESKEEAYRSLNWATYMCRTNGVVIEGPVETAQNSPCWFTDGHGDYVRHFMVALGAVPEWAPPGQNHIVRSTSVIRSVNYGVSNSVAYTTFDQASTETLRLAFTPGSVLVNGVGLPQRSDLSQPGWVFDTTNSVLRIRHDTGTNVQVLAEVLPLGITTTTLPTAIADVPYVVTLTAIGGIPPYDWSVTNGALPPGLTLNTNTGVITGTPTNLVTGIFNFTLQARDAGNPAGVATRPLSITNVGSLISLAVTPANPAIPVGASQQFTATGTCSDGSTPDVTGAATWSSSNTAVATVNAGGFASAVAMGVSSISATLAGVTGSSTITMLPPPLTVVTASLQDGTVGAAYSTTLAASGGITPYAWSIASGSLPAGMTLNTTNGSVSGTPTNAGNFFFTAQVGDAANPSQVATQALSLTVLQPPILTGLIGNTNDGTSMNSLWADGASISACRFQAASNMTVSTIHAKVTAITGGYKCAIYNSASFQPNTLLRSTTEITNASDGWHIFSLTNSQALTSNAYYWLAIWSDDSNARVYYSGNNVLLRRHRRDYGAWPSPITTTSSGSLNYCIHAVGMIPTLTAISVNPTNPVILAGTAQQFMAMASYSDGSTQNITSQAGWNSSSAAVAIIASNGLASSVSPGSTTISAALSGFIGSTTLTVPAPPVAFDQSLTNAEDLPLAITLAASDPGGPVTNFVVVANPAHGTLSGTAPNVSYLPATNFFGSDSFSFQVNNGSLTSAVATVTLTVTNVNDAPVADEQSLTNAEDTAFAITLTGSDVDGPVTNYVVVTNPVHGVLSGGGATRTYTPATNFFGGDSFTFRVNDGSLTSAVATVSITLTSVNDAPVLPAPPDIVVGVFGQVVVTNTATDVDSPAEGLSYTLLSGTSATISTNGVIAWIPRTGPGTNRLTTIVSDDGEPAARATNAFNVVVTNAVEPPVIQTLTVTDGVATVVWNTMSNGIYRLQGVDEVGKTNWLDLTPDLTATGTTAAATNVVGSQPLRFYRVIVVP